MICAGVGMLFSFGAVLVALFVAAALLRAAVALANRALGTKVTETVVGWDWDSSDDADEIRVTVGNPPVPEPGLGRGMLIVFLAAVANAAAYALGAALFAGLDDYVGGPTHALISAAAAAVGFGALTALLAAMLPTTVRRAALAALFTYLILAALATLVGAAVALVLL